MLCRFILLFLLSELQAQTFQAAPFLGMGNAGMGQRSLYSISSNPAGIASLSNVQAGVAYQHHFLTSEIQSQAAFLAIPLMSSANVAFGVNSYGLSGVSNLLTVKGAYAKRFGQTFSLAFAGNYHRYYVKNYEHDHTVSLDLGLQHYVSDNLTVGALARNASKSVFKDDVLQYIPMEFAAGFFYKLSEELRIASDLCYDLHAKFNCRGGVEYTIDSRVSLRGGMASHPAQYFAGAGLVLGKFLVDIASSFHPRLGTSPQLALAYGF